MKFFMLQWHNPCLEKNEMKTDFDSLQENDVYSLILFIIYKLSDLKEYSVISDLIYLLDKKSLLKLCNYFGGMTIKIPRIQDIEETLNLVDAYWKVDVMKTMTIEQYCESIDIETRFLKKSFINKYYEIRDILKEFKFGSNTN